MPNLELVTTSITNRFLLAMEDIRMKIPNRFPS